MFPNADKVRGVDYIAKGCAPVDICSHIEPNSSRVTTFCSQCSEDLCNDKPSTPARKIRTARAAPGWWSKKKAPLKDSTGTQPTTPPPVKTSTKEKRGIGSWLDAGSEVLRFVNNRMESEAAAVAQAQAQAALSSSARLYLSRFILFLSFFKFIVLTFVFLL